MEKITVRGRVQLAFEFFGQKHDPLVVFISGAGAPAAFWPDFFCKNLAEEGFRILRYCHRDTDVSTHFDDPYDIWELLKDLESLIDSTDNSGVHLVGHSMGGFLAQMALCYTSTPIQSLVSISAGSAVDSSLHKELGMSAPTDATWKVLLENQPSGNFEKDLEGWLSTWEYLNGSLFFDREHAMHYTRSLYKGDARNFQVAANHVHAMSTVPVDLVRELPKSRCPFLVLHGTDDPLVPFDNGEVTARLVSNSTFIGLEGAGHMYFNKHIWLRIQDHVLEHLKNH